MKTKRIVTTALMLAIASLLSLFTPFHLPFGGGITIASMLPVVIVSYIYGAGWGFVAGFVYSLIQLLLGAGTVSAFFLPGESQLNVACAIAVCFLDYIAAYTVLGLGGIFKSRFKSQASEITAGSIIALGARYLMHIISGALFFGQWAEWFFSQEGFYTFGSSILEKLSDFPLSVVYSVFYNGLYMVPEIIITAILAPFVCRIVLKNR